MRVKAGMRNKRVVFWLAVVYDGGSRSAAAQKGGIGL
ncbi:hypothetical protein AEAC466_12150 [Asticcacaulis sp. AC466]|nr:hypothetical protein AEAC466_12150 [Asticcacaulis sp. AC466]